MFESRTYTQNTSNSVSNGTQPFVRGSNTASKVNNTQPFIQQNTFNGCNPQNTGVSDPEAIYASTLVETTQRIQRVRNAVQTFNAIPTSRASDAIRPHLNRVFNCPETEEIALILSYYNEMLRILPLIHLDCTIPLNPTNTPSENPAQNGSGNPVIITPWSFRRTATGWGINFNNIFFSRPLRGRSYILIQAVAKIAGVPFNVLSNFFDYSVPTQLYTLDIESYALLAYLFTGENPYSEPGLPPCENAEEEDCSAQGAVTGDNILLHDIEGNQTHFEIRRGHFGGREFICDHGIRRNL